MPTSTNPENVPSRDVIEPDPYAMWKATVRSLRRVVPYVDVEEIERLVRRVAQLQHDLPQVRALQLPLVLAGAAGATVLGASVRVEPVKDPRSDWFVRRLSTMPGDTLPD